MSKMILDKIGIMNTRSFLLTLVNAYSVIVWKKLNIKFYFLHVLDLLNLRYVLDKSYDSFVKPSSEQFNTLLSERCFLVISLD